MGINLRQRLSPLDAPGVASGIAVGTPVSYTDVLNFTQAASFVSSAATAPGTGASSSFNNSTTYVDAVNYTGAGYLSLVILISAETRGMEADIILDGVTVFSTGGVLAQLNALPVVGTISFAQYVDSGTNVEVMAQVSEGNPLVFYNSCQIRYKRDNASGSGTPNVGVIYKLVKKQV